MSDERKPFDVIFLQWQEDEAGDEYDGPYHDQDEVTWCQDCINDSDIEYLLATPERKAAGELLTVLEELIEELAQYGDTGWYDMPSKEKGEDGRLITRGRAAINKARGDK